jgi:replicative DNA helicase
MSTEFKKELSSLAGSSRNRKTKDDFNALALGKVPPQAKELEEAILGAIMLEKDKFPDVLEILNTAECFYVDAHQRIYGAIIRLNNKGYAIDLLTVAEELKKTDELELVGGPYFLTKLTHGVVSSAHVIGHARIVLEKFIQRELIKICSKIINSAYEDKSDVFEMLDKAETDLFDIGNNYLRKNYSSLQDILVETIDQIEKARDQKDDITGVPSGFPSLDAITAGWQPTDLIILAARPAVGKTAFALNLAMNAAMNATNPRGVAVFSLEMGSTQLVKRMLSAVTDVRLESITRGQMEDYEFKQLHQRMDKLAKAPIFLDDQAGLNIFELRAKCRRLKAKHDLQLIIIDYLQLMQGHDKSGNREQEISKISRELKGLAKELEVPIIALSQLSRAVETRSGDKGKIPQLSDLRESGAIEQDADMVIFIYRPEYHGITNDEMGQPIPGETHINIAKHRNGRLDSVRLQAKLEYQKFIELPQNENDFIGGNNFNSNAGFGNFQQESGASSLVLSPGFQTMQSKANNMSFDEEDEFGGANPAKGFKFKDPSEEDDIPF